MLRCLYSLLFYMAMPLIALRLLWRSRHNINYRHRFKERLGKVPSTVPTGSVWWHTVSVGEALAAMPLIKQFHSNHPAIPLLLTTMTPTGMAQIQQRLATIATALYIPYDAPLFIQRFLNTVKPKILIIMETELWPNLIYYCHQYAIPVIVINARLSAKSYRGYHYLKSLTRNMLQQLTALAAQNAADAERFLQLGLPPAKLSITGSIKWDINIAINSQVAIWREQWGKQRLVWIAASTHVGEEAAIWQAYQQIQVIFPDVLLIWAPRHPERAVAIKRLCTTAKLVYRSREEIPTIATNIFVIDTLGELALFYQAADVVFIGGSLIAQGGHNMLEPAVLAKPLITGPHVFNFTEIVEKLIEVQGLIIISNAKALAQQVIHLFNFPIQRVTMGQAALATVVRNRGATAKQLAFIEALIL